jgi:hypothetical protein
MSCRPASTKCAITACTTPPVATTPATCRMFFCWSSRPTHQVPILQTPSLPVSPPTLRNRAGARIARQAISGSSDGCRRPDRKGRDHAAPDADFSDTISTTRRLVARSTAHARALVRMPHNRCKSPAQPLNRRITACPCAVPSCRRPAGCRIPPPDHLPPAVEISIRLLCYPAENSRSDASVQPSLRARQGGANSDSFDIVVLNRRAGVAGIGSRAPQSTIRRRTAASLRWMTTADLVSESAIILRVCLDHRLLPRR